LNFPCKLLLEKDGSTIKLEGADQYLKDYKHSLFSQRNSDGTLGVYLVPNDDTNQRKMFAVIPTAPDDMEYAGWEIDGDNDQKYLTPVFKPKRNNADASKEIKSKSSLSSRNPVLSTSLKSKINEKEVIEVIDLCDDEKDSVQATQESSLTEASQPDPTKETTSSKNSKGAKKDVRPMFLFSNYAAANLARSAVKEIDSDKHLFKIDLKSSFKPSMIQKPLDSAHNPQQTSGEVQKNVTLTEGKTTSETLRATIPGLKDAHENRTQFLKPLPSLVTSSVRSTTQPSTSYVSATPTRTISASNVTISQTKTPIVQHSLVTKSSHQGGIVSSNILPSASLLPQFPSVQPAKVTAPISNVPLVMAPVFQPFVLTTQAKVNKPMLTGSSHLQYLSPSISAPLLPSFTPAQAVTSATYAPCITAPCITPVIAVSNAPRLTSSINSAKMSSFSQFNTSQISQLTSNANSALENQTRKVTTVFPADILNSNMLTSVPVIVSSAGQTITTCKAQTAPVSVLNNQQSRFDRVVYTLPDVVTLNSPSTVKLSTGKNFGTVESGQHLVYVAPGRTSPQIVQLRKEPVISDAKLSVFSPVTGSSNLQLSQPHTQGLTFGSKQIATELRTMKSSELVREASKSQKTVYTPNILTKMSQSFPSIARGHTDLNNLPSQSSLHTLQTLRSKVISENQTTKIPNIEISTTTNSEKENRRLTMQTQSYYTDPVGNIPSVVNHHKEPSAEKNGSQTARPTVNDDSALDIRIGTVFSLATKDDNAENSTEKERLCSMSDRFSFDPDRPWLTTRSRMPLHEVLFWNETRKLKLPRTAVADQQIRRQCAVVLTRCRKKSHEEKLCSKKCRKRVLRQQERRLSKIHNLKKLRKSLYLKLKLRLYPKPSGVVSNLRSATSTSPPKRYVEDDLTTDIFVDDGNVVSEKIETSLTQNDRSTFQNSKAMSSAKTVSNTKVVSEKSSVSKTLKQDKIISQSNPSISFTSTASLSKAVTSVAVTKHSTIIPPLTTTPSVSQAQKFFMLTVDGKRVLIPSANLTESNPKAYVLDQRSTAIPNLPLPGTPNYAPYITGQEKVSVARQYPTGMVVPRLAAPIQQNTLIPLNNPSIVSTRQPILVRPLGMGLESIRRDTGYPDNPSAQMSVMKTPVPNKVSSTIVPLSSISRMAVNSVPSTTPTVVNAQSSYVNQMRPSLQQTQNIHSTNSTRVNQPTERITVTTVITRPTLSHQQNVSSSRSCSIATATTSNPGKQSSITSFVSKNILKNVTTASPDPGKADSTSGSQTTSKYSHPLIKEPISSVGKSKAFKGTKYYFVPGGVIVKTEPKELKHSSSSDASKSLKRQLDNESLPPNKYQKLTHDILRSDDKIKKVQDLLDDRRKKLEEIKKRNTS
ncbi:hypothetical protein FSP39_015365, partial [Pinctada imbricata]